MRNAFAGIIIASVILAGGPGVAGEQIAGRARVSVSSAPNPLWTPEKAVDGDFDRTSGWLGDWGEYAPWIQLAWDEKVWIDEISLMQANFREAGSKRYARPKQVRLEFDSGERLEFTLQDNESALQRMTFEPVGTASLRIVITSVYPDARIRSLTGFQEIEVYKTDRPIPAAQLRGIQEAIVGEAAASGTFTEQERRILMLLNELMLELEEYFSHN